MLRKGDSLDGSPVPHDILSISGSALAAYLVKEIQMYIFARCKINDKHIEVIVRQSVLKSGSRDSTFLVVSKFTVQNLQKLTWR